MVTYVHDLCNDCPASLVCASGVLPDYTVMVDLLANVCSEGSRPMFTVKFSDEEFRLQINMPQNCPRLTPMGFTVRDTAMWHRAPIRQEWKGHCT